MERDNLKKYLQQYRDDFDHAELPPQLFRSVLAAAHNRRTRKRRRITFLVTGTCLSLLIGLCYLYFFHQTGIEERSIPVALQDELPETMARDMQPEDVWEKKNEIIAHTADKKIIAKRRDPFQEVLTVLRDDPSVARRIDALLTIDENESESQRLMGDLRKSFENDESSNVRLAALNILMKNMNDTLNQRSVLRRLDLEKDPIIQMELVKVAEYLRNPAVIQKLIQIAEDPLTLEPVRAQVVYMLFDNHSF